MDICCCFAGTTGSRAFRRRKSRKSLTNGWPGSGGSTDEGKAVAGNPLEREGKIVSGKNRVVSDGPFAESKEAIGGYFLLDVASMDEAVAIAQECPGLPYGARVEVRPVAGECPIAADIRAEAQFAQV